MLLSPACFFFIWQNSVVHGTSADWVRGTVSSPA